MEGSQAGRAGVVVPDRRRVKVRGVGAGLLAAHLGRTKVAVSRETTLGG